MQFKTTYFMTRQQALAYFNKVAREHIAFLCKDNESYFGKEWFVATESDYRFYREQFYMDMTLELCSE